MSEYRLGGPAAQQLHVVNAVPAGDHGVDQGEQLAPWAGRPAGPEIDQLVGALLDPQPLHQRGGQQQPGRSDRTLVVERHIDLVQHHARGWRASKVSSDSGIMTAWQPSFSVVRRPFFRLLCCIRGSSAR